MKPSSVASIASLSLFAGVAALSVLAAVPARADDVKFTCGMHQGVPATLAQTTRGNIPVIRWVSDAFGGEYPPQYRCQVVSPKFQQYYKEGKLNYLTTGVANNQPIVCGTNEKGGPCTGVLFTLKHGSDPWLTLTRLMDVRAQAGPPLNESASSSSTSNPEQYIDMNEYLNTASATEPNVSESAPPSSDAPGQALF
jgi:Circadian oscillating protein COP23